MSAKVFFGIVLIFYITMMVITFRASLPNWCANPQGTGNWIVQPLCHKE